MSEIRFEWDPRKATSNKEKQRRFVRRGGIGLLRRTSPVSRGPQPAGEEERFVLLGLSAALRVLVVVHALREQDVIRIISARKATRPGRQQYQSRLR